eukprot:m.196333 g.196333  ORF g.196333 m.196333 type:complete len:742 (-) comp16816_c5_seq1:276-2501(-)
MTSTQTVAAKKAAETRRFDAVYERDFYVSERDHTRALARAYTQDAPKEPLPDSHNMFSALNHYPNATIRLSHNDTLPASMPVEHQAAVRRAQAQVDYEQAQPSGRDLMKYARMPMRPTRSAFMDYEPLLRFDEGSTASAIAIPRELPPGTMVTIGTQTDYRDSEAQTDPYTPEYTVRPGSAPEVLTLATLSFGYGLPAGIAEVEMIERARQRREWESQLPPADDPYRAIERAKAMEEQELKEWQHRERQIQNVQDERLRLLQELVIELQEKKQLSQDEKLEKAYQRRQAELDKIRAKEQRDGIMRLRKLTKERQNVENMLERRNIVREYADSGSQTFAPLTRTGTVALVSAQKRTAIKPRQLSSYEGLLELEANLPRSVTTARIRTAPSSRQMGKTANMKARLKQTLERLDQTLTLQRTGQLGVLPPIRSIEKIEKPPVRPPTPELSDTEMEDYEKRRAISLLQALIRGRAVQNEMYEGKEQRRDLIAELRATHALSKAHQEIKAKEREAALKQRERQAAEERRRRLLDWVVTDVQAEHVGSTIDFLSKELVRLQEERRIHAFAMLAERERRMREAEEAGRRQEEEARRAEHDEIFRQIMNVHRSTIESYLEDIILETEDEVADEQARTVVRDRVEKINKVADEMHESGFDATEEGAAQIAAQLVNSFLLPEVEREAAREQLQREQSRFLVAAHRDMLEASHRIETVRQNRRPSTVMTTSSTVEQSQLDEQEATEEAQTIA